MGTDRLPRAQVSNSHGCAEDR
uniref:Uncharacterized protein n=1 Tax=Arundo donax TaxID=35708 RepID=A0A0A9BIU2_ARUDO